MIWNRDRDLRNVILVVRFRDPAVTRSIWDHHDCLHSPYHTNMRQLIAIDTNEQPWEERFNEKLGRAIYRKNLLEDPETGMEIRLVRYPAGVINPRHTHPCAHGMYVLRSEERRVGKECRL